MKRYAVYWGCLVAAMLLVPLVTTAAEQFPLPPGLARIAREANAIDEGLAAAQVQTKVFTRGGQSGVLSYYTVNNIYSKLVVQLVSEQSGDVTEYYFNNGDLIYVVEACKNFNSSVKVGSLCECKSISEDRFYISEGKLTGWMTGEGNGMLTLRPVRIDAEVFARKLMEITSVAKLWRAFVDSPITDLLDFESSTSTTTPPVP